MVLIAFLLQYNSFNLVTVSEFNKFFLLTLLCYLCVLGKITRKFFEQNFQNIVNNLTIIELQQQKPQNNKIINKSNQLKVPEIKSH